MNKIVWLIIACEVAFWIVILAGLSARYLFRKERLGFWLLAMTPVIDLILLISTGIDLYRGASASTAHGLAAVYIGVSIAFGKNMIAWADEKFRVQVLKHSPTRRPLYGLEHAKHYFKGFLRHILAYAIGAGLLVGLIYWVDAPDRTKALWDILRIWTVVLGIDFLITLSYFIWPKKAEPHQSTGLR